MQNTVQNTGPVPNLSRNNSPYLLLLNTAPLPLEIGDELSKLFFNILTFEAMITLFH